jgi:hypothetical protein
MPPHSDDVVDEAEEDDPPSQGPSLPNQGRRPSDLPQRRPELPPSRGFYTHAPPRAGEPPRRGVRAKERSSPLPASTRLCLAVARDDGGREVGTW